MSLWHCTACTTAYSVGAPCCPHCGSTEHEEDGMPKITKHGGPSYEGHVDVSPDDVDEPDWAPVEDVTPGDTAPEDVDEPTVEDDPAPDAPQSPARNASREAWEDYAVACGHNRDALGEFSRAELIELVGDES